MPLNDGDVDAYVELKWHEVKDLVEIKDFPPLEREGVEKATRLALGKGFLDGYRTCCDHVERRLSAPKKR